MDKPITVAILIAAFVTLVGIAAALRRPTNTHYLFAAVAIIAIDLSVTVFTPKIPNALGYDLQWNWAGKSASILFSVIILTLLPTLRAQSGLTLSQKRGSVKWSLTLGAIAATIVGFLTWPEPPQPVKIETLLYQLLMPSLAEELMYRAIIVGLLTCVWPTSLHIAGIPISLAAIVSTAFFGIIHGLAWQDGLQFAVVSYLYATIVGAILMFVRWRSRSLLYPMLLHSLLNLVSHGIPMLR
jgi:membrane protease YdiL (CAAX protease family)